MTLIKAHRCLSPFVLAIFFASHHVNLYSDPLITYPLIINTHEIRVELANEPIGRAQGLMARKSLRNDRGMVFAFPTERVFSMWMKDTPLDLTVLFADKQGRIIEIAKMKRNTLDSHSSNKPAMFALEINSDSPLTKIVKVGDRLLGLEKLPAAKN